MPDASAGSYTDDIATPTKKSCPEKGSAEIDVFTDYFGRILDIKCDYRENGIFCKALSNGHPVACYQYRNTRIGKLAGL